MANWNAKKSKVSRFPILSVTPKPWDPCKNLSSKQVCIYQFLGGTPKKNESFLNNPTALKLS